MSDDEIEAALTIKKAALALVMWEKAYISLEKEYRSLESKMNIAHDVLKYYAGFDSGVMAREALAKIRGNEK